MVSPDRSIFPLRLEVRGREFLMDYKPRPGAATGVIEAELLATTPEGAVAGRMELVLVPSERVALVKWMETERQGEGLGSAMRLKFQEDLRAQGYQVLIGEAMSDTAGFLGKFGCVFLRDVGIFGSSVHVKNLQKGVEGGANEEEMSEASH